MTHRRLWDFIDHAFAKASPIRRARFGELVAEILVDNCAWPLGFERALLQTEAPVDARFAIVVGDDAAFRKIVPEVAGEAHVLSNAEIYAYWRPAPEQVFYVFDRASRWGVAWFPHTTVPAWALGQPCVPLIHAAIEHTDWCLAHAAAVGRGGRFLVLTGPGKAGKSTATLACVRAGWDYAGDDLVLLNPLRGLVAPLFSSARLRQTGAAAFKSFADAAFMVSDDEGMARYELRLSAPPMGGEVAAILGLHRRGAARVSVTPARPADYMGPLLRDSAARAPGAALGMTRKLLAAGRMAPAFVVDTGTEPSTIPHGFDALLGSLQ